MARQKTGFLLINLGTPESTKVSDVRAYLRQFLSDPRVLDIPAIQRWLILNLFILPFRPRQSAEAYQKVWLEEGSPLLVYTRDLTQKVQERLGTSVQVECAMRYGEPSIADVLERFRRQAIDRIVVFPLYPQYASATTGSSVEELFRCAMKLWNTPSLQILPAFYENPEFIRAFAARARETCSLEEVDRVLFSFHGLPERQVCKSDDTGEHCLKKPSCCDTIGSANRNCYRAQCFATARSLGDALQVPADKRIVCFQSRLGRTPWIKPYTDHVLEELAREGIKRIAVFSPAFVADCLETIEELGIRAREDWLRLGWNDVSSHSVS